MAKALENNGATVYIIGRRLDVLQKAAREHNVRQYWALVFVRAPCFKLFMRQSSY